MRGRIELSRFLLTLERTYLFRVLVSFFVWYLLFFVTRASKPIASNPIVGEMSRSSVLQRTLKLALKARCNKITSACLMQGQIVRFYKGGAGEGIQSLSDREEALYNMAKPRADAIMAKHTSLPDIQAIPLHSFAPNPSPNAADEIALDIRRKRLVYRSKQRGWLEVDLLLGTWASENVPNLSAKELDEFEAFVNAETIDIYNIVTLRLDVPDEWKTSNGGGIVERIQKWAESNPLGKADPEKYKELKATAKLI
jgi:succinate dehydrogenase assembly factor 2